MKIKMIALAALLGAASLSAHAGVHFGFGINLPFPVITVAAPAPVFVAAPPVYAAPVYAAPAYAPAYAYAAPACAAPVVVAPCGPAPGYVWSPGYWSSSFGGRVWVSGGWHRQDRYGFGYVHHRW